LSRTERKNKLDKVIDPSDGRAVVVAADHGMMLGPISGAANLEQTLRKVVEGKPDGILMSPGQAERLSYLFHGKLSPALLIRGDWTNAFRDRTYTLPARSTQFCRIASVKRAVRLGADAVTIYLFIGYQDKEQEERHLEQAKRFSSECNEWGMPLVIEPIPMGPRVTKTNYHELVRESVSLSVEAGADALKVPYTGDPETFASVIAAAKGVPVLVLGGSKALSDREPLEAVEESLGVGASGVVFGRNVIQSSDPARFLTLVREVVHGGKTAREALAKGRQGRLFLRTNPDLCTGCRICVSACAVARQGNFDTSKARLKVVDLRPGPSVPVVCDQCGKCVQACPTGALTMDERVGGLMHNRDLCTLCGACVAACPNQLPIMDSNTVYVCNLCSGWPECADWCPTGAIFTEVKGTE
jgi:class I fructose-bisphosphate aldolase